ncbi:MAG: prolyl oligopeptidase family serine peptidase [Gemmatimonadota bacterium]
MTLRSPLRLRRVRLATCAVLVVAGSRCGGEYPAPPESRVDPVVDVIHGVEIADDYRWLEDQEAAETRRWIQEQNAYAEAVVGESPLRDRIRGRLKELMDIPDVGSPRKAGDFEYFTMRRPGEEAARVYRRPAPEDEDAEEPGLDGEYEVVLDPAAFDPTYRTLISMSGFSPDGRFLMYTIRQGGADEVEYRIRDLETGEDLPDRLPNALYSGVEFDDDGTGFTYTHRSRTEGPRIRHHTLGTDSSQDTEIWGAGIGPTAFVGMDVLADGRYRLFTVQHGWAREDLYLQDLQGSGAIHPVAVGERAHFEVDFRDGRFYILTDLGAPMYRLLLMDPSRPEPEHWEELIPEAEDLLQGYRFIDDRIYVTYLDDVSDRVAVFERNGTPAGSVEVPDHSTVSLGADGEGTASLTLTGYLRPSTTFALDLASGEREVEEESEVPFDGSAYQLDRIWYASADGTRAPMYVMHRRGIVLDGTHPTILNGYGGFNVAIKPRFSTTAAVWLELGGVYAVATLRGGNEFGESWHRDGMLENKQNVFDDFIAAAEHLIAEGYTSPEHLGISGGSNGGLLVASVMTQRPDLYRAVLCTYPDLDMIRFPQFTRTNNMPALLEYGDATDPAQFGFIRRYSPYQAVRDGVDYPAVFLATGDLDTRVPPLQARRMTARLQAASASGLPVVLWYDPRGGHAAGRGRPLSLRIEDSAREITFMAQQLGIAPPAAGQG